MTCAEAKQVLMDVVLDEVAPEQRKQVRAHLDRCEACRAEMSDLALTRKLVVQGLPEEEVPRRIAFVAADSPSGWRSIFRWRAVAVPAAVIAAFAVIAGTLSLAGTRVMVEQGRWEVAFGSAGRATVAQGVPQAVANFPAQSFTPEQVREIVLNAVRESEARQRNEVIGLVNAAASNMERRHSAALLALSGQMRLFERNQNIVYKQNEGTLLALETVASRLPAEKETR